ncbi:MAG TPA: HlyD family secretion protein [Bryobacteraceae bacterium]|nr:HlyD family secretion protein [Bryobacteraceae bacterium]
MPQTKEWESPTETGEAPKTPQAPRGRGKAMFIVLLVGLVLATGGFLFWRYAQTYESTDDAQISGHLNGVSSRVAGSVTAVYVSENQFVKAGQVMAEIDPRDYQVALEQARAEAMQARAEVEAQNPNIPITETASETNISTAQSDVENAEAAVAAAERDAAAAEARLREAQANSAKAQADVARYQGLLAKDEIPREQYDQVQATAKALAAGVDSNRASADAAQKVVDQRHAQLNQAQSRLAEAHRTAPQRVAISRADVESRRASSAAAQARVDRALLDLSYTKILAPVSGVVSKRSVEVGNHVQPGQQLFSVAQLDDLWVTADFKETQLHRMAPGQRVTIDVDAFGQSFDGYVESMPAATGAVMSLLPPENATGNYVKVVQRLPVRIRFKPGQKGLGRLRPGMSVEPKVWLQ